MNHKLPNGSIVVEDFLSADVETSFDVAFCDPPYNIGEPYEGHRDEMDPDQFFEFTRKWFTKALGCVSAAGSMFVVCPDDMVADVENISRELNLTRVNWIIWHYRFGPHINTRFIPSHAHILWYTRVQRTEVYFNFDAVAEESDRSKKYFDSRTFMTKNPGMRPPFDVWEVPRVVGNSKARVPESPNQLPREVVARCLVAACPPRGRVLDPFCGSGTTASVCEREGFSYTLYEKGIKTAEAAAARVLRDIEADKK